MHIVISGRVSATCVGRGNPLLGTEILRSLARQGQSCVVASKNMGLPPQSGVMLMQEEVCCVWGSGGGSINRRVVVTV